MSDLFADRLVRPMLIGADSGPYDDPDSIFELKLDGERCVAYLDPKTGVELRNKRDLRMLQKVPELAELHKQVRARCILDGELIVLRDGKPDFSEIQRRSLMSNRFRIELAAKQRPATFTAFDILYHQDQPVMNRPLLERKALLARVVRTETPRMAASRYIETAGAAFFRLAQAQGLEGVVGKRKDSLYRPGKRTTDWVKVKNLLDDDFVVCGYLPKDRHMNSLVLGQYQDGALVYRGHVTLGVRGKAFDRVLQQVRTVRPPFSVPPPRGNEEAVWLRPSLVCTVAFMERTAGGGMRQPVFKGIREDKAPEDCVSRA